MARRSSTLKWRLERSMPYRVDLSDPPGGFGMKLNAILDWCRDNIGPMEQCWGWGSHGDHEKDYLRLYFSDEETAKGFIEVWGGEVIAVERQRR